MCFNPIMLSSSSIDEGESGFRLNSGCLLDIFKKDGARLSMSAVGLIVALHVVSSFVSLVI